MFEQTNQTEESTLDDFAQGFEDSVENSDEYTQEADTPPEEEPAEDLEEQAENPPQETTYTLKYNGREVNVPQAELITLAQKGMNYDHVYGELQSLRNGAEIQILDKFAQQNGMSRREYVEFLRRELESRQVQEKVQQGIPEQTARRILELEQNERIRQEQEAHARQTLAKREQYNALAREYPNLKELPPQVVQAIRSGEAPLAAYRAYENRQLKQELEAAKINARNRSKALGSMADSAAMPPADDFLTGWNSE